MKNKPFLGELADPCLPSRQLLSAVLFAAPSCAVGGIVSDSTSVRLLASSWEIARQRRLEKLVSKCVQ